MRQGVWDEGQGLIGRSGGGGTIRGTQEGTGDVGQIIWDGDTAVSIWDGGKVTPKSREGQDAASLA